MGKALKQANSTLLSEVIIKGIQEKKGHDISCLDLRKVDNAICDYFIICHGDSTTQVDAIADSVLHEVNVERQEKPWNKEGFQNSEWILIDYTDVVVHVFHKPKRDFYRLEELWADAVVTNIEDQY